MRSPHTILLVDDEKNIRKALRMVLEGAGYETVEAANAADARTALAGDPVDLVLLDVKLGRDNGVELLEEIKAGKTGGDREVPIIMISGHATVEDAVRATRLGAFDFFEKPLDRERVIVATRNALAQRQMTQEVTQLRAAVEGRHEMLGNSPAMQELMRQIEKVGPTKGRVLITGESGTGKELVARAIHRAWVAANHEGKRDKDVPFVKVNCAAIPPELIESELFGHEKGSFTGATAKKRGLFEVADGGTIFLDEIGDMAANAQAKVLRVLQQNEIVRVGGEKVILVDTRVLAATNKDLETEVSAGTFREDLYYRLSVVPIRSPRLRERKEDIPTLAQAFVAQCCEENGFRVKRLAADVVAQLSTYHWPGNVRELKNVIERLVIMSDEEITVRDLPEYLGGAAASMRAPFSEPPAGLDALNASQYLAMPLREFREHSEREFIRLKLSELDWNISRTAQALGIERTNLHKKLRALGIDRKS